MQHHQTRQSWKGQHVNQGAKLPLSFYRALGQRVFPRRVPLLAWGPGPQTVERLELVCFHHCCDLLRQQVQTNAVPTLTQWGPEDYEFWQPRDIMLKFTTSLVCLDYQTLGHACLGSTFSYCSCDWYILGNLSLSLSDIYISDMRGDSHLYSFTSKPENKYITAWKTMFCLLFYFQG